MYVEVVDPTEYSQWNSIILSFPDYSVFHCQEWMCVLRDTYGYQPLGFLLYNEKRIMAALPVVGIRSCVSGRRGVSLSFSDFCEPLIADGNEYVSQLVDYILQFGHDAKWKHLEIRGQADHKGSQCIGSYNHHYIDLRKESTKVYQDFSHNTRRNIRKAEKNNIQVIFSDTLPSLRSFYRLHIRTRRRHGVPPQPFVFFKNLHRFFLAEGLGCIGIAYYENKVIAANVYLHFDKKAIYKYGASHYRLRKLRPNEILMWSAFQWYKNMGIEVLSLGRTHPENAGLNRFKNGFGPKCELVHYFQYPIVDYTPAKADKATRIGHIAGRTPLFLLRAIGKVFYKHVG